MNPSQRQLSRYGWRPADPPRRPVLFINPRSGDGKAARARLAERAREQGIETVILAAGQDLAALAREAPAADADVLGMAGDDGSLAVVAPAAAAHAIPFVCVSAGTRNHFALGRRSSHVRRSPPERKLLLVPVAATEKDV